MSWIANSGPDGATVMGGGCLSVVRVVNPRPRGWSVLDGAGGHAHRDVPLGQDQQRGRRDGGDDGGGHDGVPLLVVVADVVVDAEGDRLVVAAAGEGRGEDEVRPGPQEREQRH